MSAAVVRRTDTSFAATVEVPYEGSMLDAEEAIQRALNQAGVAATEEALSRSDGEGEGEGEPIRLGPARFTSTGRVREEYQTPCGVAAVERHASQGPEGGKTCRPLDRDARVVVRPTPRPAGMIAPKYAEFGAARVLEDLAENHGRAVAKAFVRDVADAVAAAALAKEEAWEYALPAPDDPVGTVTVGLDGASMPTCEGGWREAMVGTSGSSNEAGERLHTVYTAATPEYGKMTSFGDQVKGGRMKYAGLVGRHVPIGSGVTEAACKVMVKQRLCGSGMR